MNFIQAYDQDSDDGLNNGDRSVDPNELSELENPIVSTESSVKCEICKVALMKYKCPRCGRVSCSLECCTKHKVQFECNGKRDRTAYVSMQEYKEKNLCNDFHF